MHINQAVTKIGAVTGNADRASEVFHHHPGSDDSLQFVLDRAKPGDRVVLAPGVYRESAIMTKSGTAEAPITLEAQEPGTVTITGTDIVEGWQDGGGGRWFVEIDLSHLANSSKYGLLASRREQVFVDGHALRQVLHRDQLIGGTFFYDEAERQLWIRPQPFAGEVTEGTQEIDAGGITGGGTVTFDRSAAENAWQFLAKAFDPAEHLIEVTTRSCIFQTAGDHNKPGVEHIIIRGLTFRGSADSPQQPMVRFGGSHLLVEDCLFEAGCARGFDIRTHKSVFRRCVARLNGQMGFSGYGNDNLVEDCALLYNNTKHSDFTCFEQGGCKICRTNGWIVRGVRCVGNDGPGIWFDIDNTHATIEECWCEGNSGPGIMYEISSDAVIRNNVCVRNGFPHRKDVRFDSIANSVGHVEPVYGQGILVQMSRRVMAHNNTCVGNRRCGIELRHHPYQQAGNPGHSTETYRLEDNDVFNNLLANNGWDNLMISRAPGNPTKSDEVRNNTHDFNLFFNRDVLLQYGGDLMAYSRWGKNLAAGSMSLEEWRAATHQDLHSIQWDPYFVAPDEGNFRIEPGSPAIARGRVVSGFDRDFLGATRPAGAPAIGAFEPVLLSAAELLHPSASRNVVHSSPCRIQTADL